VLLGGKCVVWELCVVCVVCEGVCCSGRDLCCWEGVVLSGSSVLSVRVVCCSGRDLCCWEGVVLSARGCAVVGGICVVYEGFVLTDRQSWAHRSFLIAHSLIALERLLISGGKAFLIQ